MKTNKTRLFVLIALVATFVVSVACLLTACGESTPEYAIEWDVPDGTTVSVEGADKLPDTWKKGDLVFTVTAPNGYTPTVKKGKATISLKDGKYTTSITEATTIKITLDKTLNDIAVTVLRDVDYFEDNKVDQSSLKVTAKYVLGDETVTNYTISYPQGGGAFVAGDTSFTVSLGGKSATVELAKPVAAAQDFGNASLEVDKDGNPVLVVTGQYNVGGTEAEKKAAVEKYFTECLERGSWAKKEFTPEAKFTDDTHFELRLTINEWTASPTGNHYYFRYSKGGSTIDGQDLGCGVSEPTCTPSNTNDDLSLTTYEGEPKEGKNGAKLYIGKCENWGSKAVMIVAVDENAPKFTNVSLEVKDNKPYAVFNGTGKELTQEKLLALIVHLDMEDVKNGNVKLGDNFVDESAIVDENRVKIEINAAEETFKVYVLLEGEQVVDGAAFFAHMGAKSGDYYPNVTLQGDENAKSITCGGFTFTFATAAELELTEPWQASVLYIKVTTAA